MIDVILRLSQLVSDFPQILEMDLNPVMAFSDKIVAVDARIAI
jgi:acetyltransferase